MRPMRMVHYFGSAALLVIPALLWTAWTGMFAPQRHIGVGLFSAVFAVGVHSLLILFMIVTGRVLKEAMRTRPLGAAFLGELNEFFARKRAYPLAIFAVLAVVVAAVLGYGHRGFGTPPALHWIAGLAAVVVNLLVIPIEYRTLRDNQALLDRAAVELDRIDRDLAARAASDAMPSEEGYDPRNTARWGLIVAVSAWFPYLYWALVVWKGQFDRLPWGVHPWLEASIFGLVVWFLARRDAHALPARHDAHQLLAGHEAARDGDGRTPRS